MNNYVLDSYAWIEYLNETAKGAIVQKIIENTQHSIFTHPSTLSEVISVTQRRGFNSETSSLILSLLSFQLIFQPEKSENKPAFHPAAEPSR